MGSRMNLLEIGKDFDIIIRGTSGYTSRGQLRKARFRLDLKTETIKVSIKQLGKKIKDLIERYPKKNYYLERRKYAGKVYWRFGRKEEKMRGIPLYYSATDKRLYVPSSYVKRKYRLTCSVISYRLRDLGIPYTMTNLG